MSDGARLTPYASHSCAVRHTHVTLTGGQGAVQGAAGAVVRVGVQDACVIQQNMVAGGAGTNIARSTANYCWPAATLRCVSAHHATWLHRIFKSQTWRPNKAAPSQATSLTLPHVAPHGRLAPGRLAARPARAAAAATATAAVLGGALGARGGLRHTHLLLACKQGNGEAKSDGLVILDGSSQ
jgi:hypothetical protein